ncbi:MAG: MlaE family lipid ABC transporter permease subunit [Alphaproteobacteria bacterium]|nr:MlaE family lipid ABC transporter permease subunit [Alphaproteobacteria bacterium]
MDDATAWLKTSQDGGRLILVAGGSWTIRDAADLESALEEVSPNGVDAASIELSGVTEMDTAGAWLVRRTALAFEASGVPIDIRGMADAYLPLGRIVELTADCATRPVSIPHNYWRAMVERVGRATLEFLDEGKALLNFYGRTVAGFGALVRRPGRLRYTALVNQVELTGLNAIPIVCLLSFLIGIVIAFVGADQLRRFGAEIFTVNLLGVIMLREIGVLMTAIMVAGRSGSAYTAQIGTMQVNEEIDALRTLGLDPMDVLVIPRICGLLISLPILAFLAEIAGLLGGAMMATMVLDVTFTQFVRQLESVVTLNHFAVGMVKAPVFAYIIAIVGCYEGLRVGGSAESVGRMTTKSVVTSIFLVIIADAIFSVIFSTMRI